MWKNDIVADFVEWLKEHNAKQETDQMVGIHGLDVYSQENSQKEVLEKLRADYPSLLSNAETAYLHTKTLWGETDPKSAKKVVHEVENLYQQNPESDELFDLLQNARCVQGGAEYRTKYDPASSWNYRDTFMFITLTRLVERRSLLDGRQAKAIIWAHNSHLGDSTHTCMPFAS
jgi:erythromycin esterase-like protein